MTCPRQPDRSATHGISAGRNLIAEQCLLFRKGSDPTCLWSVMQHPAHESTGCYANSHDAAGGPPTPICSPAWHRGGPKQTRSGADRVVVCPPGALPTAMKRASAGWSSGSRNRDTTRTEKSRPAIPESSGPPSSSSGRSRQRPRTPGQSGHRPEVASSTGSEVRRQQTRKTRFKSAGEEAVIQGDSRNAWQARDAPQDRDASQRLEPCHRTQVWAMPSHSSLRSSTERPRPPDRTASQSRQQPASLLPGETRK